MKKKQPARLTVLLPPEGKEEFTALCADLGLVPSEVIRELIADFIERDDKAPLLAPTRQAAKPPPGRGGAH